MKKNKRLLNILFLLALCAGTIWIIRQKQPTAFQTNKGLVFGTTYTVKYEYSQDLQKEIEQQLKKVDAALSMFNDSSTVSRLNRNETNVALDSMFQRVCRKGLEVSRNTGGLYDVTVAPLCNAWGFGFDNQDNVTQSDIDSILQFVGYEKVALRNGQIVKADQRVQMDFSSIAKGYGSDVVGDFLRSKGIQNFMVEIGGEVVASGKNPKGDFWRIGINKPIDDSLCTNNEIEEVLKISNTAVATSGNYRNFYIKDGEKYAHTINPNTGYPVTHSLLSATVVADDCMTADAYATAFMVMGLEKALIYADTAQAVKGAYFISGNGTGGYKIDYTNDMGLFLDNPHK